MSSLLYSLEEDVPCPKSWDDELVSQAQANILSPVLVLLTYLQCSAKPWNCVNESSSWFSILLAPVIRVVLSFRKTLLMRWPPEASFTVLYMCATSGGTQGRHQDARSGPLLAFLQCSCAFYKQPQTVWHCWKIYQSTNAHDNKFLAMEMLALMLS